MAKAKSKLRKEGSMFYRCSVAFCLLFLSSAVAHAGEVEKELEQLQGDWVAVFREVSGIAFKANEFPRIEMTIKEDKWISKVGNKSTFTITLDPRVEPKQFDKKCTEGPLAGIYPGIYKLEGDMLTIISNGGGKDRPKTFSTKDNPSFHLYVFKRMKP
jgi:uncharacterized protein (TIGR03067 family)